MNGQLQPTNAKSPLPWLYLLNKYSTECVLTSGSSHAERDGEKRSLTEPAVDDFAARMIKDTEMNNRHGRATVYMELASRCRSLAAVR